MGTVCTDNQTSKSEEQKSIDSSKRIAQNKFQKTARKIMKGNKEKQKDKIYEKKDEGERSDQKKSSTSPLPLAMTNGLIKNVESDKPQMYLEKYHVRQVLDFNPHTTLLSNRKTQKKTDFNKEKDVNPEEHDEKGSNE